MTCVIENVEKKYCNGFTPSLHTVAMSCPFNCVTTAHILYFHNDYSFLPPAIKQGTESTHCELWSGYPFISISQYSCRSYSLPTEFIGLLVDGWTAKSVVRNDSYTMTWNMTNWFRKSSTLIMLKRL